MEQILKGTPVAKQILSQLTNDIALLYDKGVIPRMVVFQVGHDPASDFYIQSIQKKGSKIGAHVNIIKLSSDITQDDLIKNIQRANKDSTIHGIMLQLPLPEAFEQNDVVFVIDPNKDIDGLHPLNAGKLMLGQDGFVPCTPAAVLELLKFYDINTVGSNIVILGRSTIVGKPLMNLLVQKNNQGNATVTMSHSRTKNIREITKKADIVIVAIGKAEFVDQTFLSSHSIVIDVGINEIYDKISDSRRYVGDVDFEEAKDFVSAITPVPGGVGTVTTASLLKNLVKAAHNVVKS